MTGPTTTLSKRARFVASHHYWLPQWTEATNKARFRGCANRNGHGHNYWVDVSLNGPVSDQTGFIVNFFDFDPMLQRILAPLDHAHLNLDVPYFQNHLPTLENIAHYLAGQITLELSHTQPGVSLATLKVWETERLWVTHSGDASIMNEPLVLSLTRRYQFSAAHQLWDSSATPEQNTQWFGPCTRVHGHNYQLEVTVSGRVDPTLGMICDIEVLDQLVESHILSQLDHHHLDQDVAFLASRLSTVEYVADSIFQKLDPHITTGDIQLEQIRLYETPDNWVDVIRQKAIAVNQKGVGV